MSKWVLRVQRHTIFQSYNDEGDLEKAGHLPLTIILVWADQSLNFPFNARHKARKSSVWPDQVAQIMLEQVLLACNHGHFMLTFRDLSIPRATTRRSQPMSHSLRNWTWHLSCLPPETTTTDILIKLYKNPPTVCPVTTSRFPFS